MEDHERGLVFTWSAEVGDAPGVHTLTVRVQSFTGVVQAGHKEDAVEVPFDPARLWGSKTKQFMPGRRGIAVCGRIEGVEFTSQVVRRSGKHWLLLPTDAERAAGLQVGSAVTVSLTVPVESST